MKSRLLSILLVASILISGCAMFRAPACVVQSAAEPGTYEFYPPTGFTPEENQQIFEASETWNKVTKPDHKINFSYTGHLRILKFPPDNPNFDGQWPGNGVMFIRPGRPDILRIATHEFGHALGMGHIPSPGSVMCSFDQNVDCGPTGSSTISADDMTECRRVGACP